MNVMNNTARKIDPDLPHSSVGVRMGREVLMATRPYAVESVVQSWWQVGSTFVLLSGAFTGAGLASA